MSEDQEEDEGPLELENSFTLWCMRRNEISKKNANFDYEKSTKPIGEFNTVEGFWKLYSSLRRLTDLDYNVDCHLFRSGIKPLWEDPMNLNGGKLTFRVKREGIACMRYWEALMLGLIGETLDPLHDEVCGVIVSIRSNTVILSVWNKNHKDLDAIAEMKERIKTLLGLPGFVKIDYKKQPSNNVHKK